MERMIFLLGFVASISFIMGFCLAITLLQRQYKKYFPFLRDDVAGIGTSTNGVNMKPEFTSTIQYQ